MNREEPIKNLIELAENLSKENQERLACVAQGMVFASMAAERRIAQTTDDTRSA